jgi:hypothetical protein
MKDNTILNDVFLEDLNIKMDIGDWGLISHGIALLLSFSTQRIIECGLAERDTESISILTVLLNQITEEILMRYLDNPSTK